MILALPAASPTGHPGRRSDRRPGPELPSPRGPVSHAVVKALSRPPGLFRVPPVRTDEVLTNEDLQLALYCCYELHYQGFARVSDDWEWNPSLLELRGELERAFEASLRAELPDDGAVAARDVPDACGNSPGTVDSRCPAGCSSTGHASMRENSPSTGPGTS